MLKVDKLQEAIKFGCKAHENDKWGDCPYAVHLSLVAVEARKLDRDNEDLEIAAWLHDVIEDHPEYSERLGKEFPEVYEAVLTVSRKHDETYNEFIQRVLDSGNELAIKLKFIDMSVNLNNLPTKAGLKERYEKHIGRLQKQVQSFYQD